MTRSSRIAFDFRFLARTNRYQPPSRSILVFGFDRPIRSTLQSFARMGKFAVRCGLFHVTGISTCSPGRQAV